MTTELLDAGQAIALLVLLATLAGLAAVWLSAGWARPDQRRKR